MFIGAILYGYVVVVVALTLSSNSNAKREFHNNVLTTLHYLKQLKVTYITLKSYFISNLLIVDKRSCY